MAKYPWLTRRQSGVYYLRAFVPKHLHAIAGKKEIPRSLNTKDKTAALQRYRVEAKGVQDLIDGWQGQLDQQSDQPVFPAQSTNDTAQSISADRIKQWAAEHYLSLVDSEFEWRAQKWTAAQADPDGFHSGALIEHPKSEWYYAFAEEMDAEDRFLCCCRHYYETRLKALKKALALADCSRKDELARLLLQGIAVSASDQLKLRRALLESEVAAIQAILKEDNTSFEPLLAQARFATAATTLTPPLKDAKNDGERLSTLLPRYLKECKDRDLAQKTLNSNDSDVREFMVIVGDKPVRNYTNEDGLLFKTVLRTVPSQRKVDPFKRLDIAQAAALAEKNDPDQTTIPRLHTTTVNNKIYVVGDFFVWANNQYKDVANPLLGLRIDTKKKNRNSAKLRKRQPFTIEQLTKLFTGPIYTGCKSLSEWKLAGHLIPRESARYWVPLLALFTGMRLGEIIQLHVADVKTADGIPYLSVTTIFEEDDDQEADKSVKNANSIRSMPIHNKLIEFGFLDFVAQRRQAKSSRIFIDYNQSNDGSWSKTFSKFFLRYRRSLGVEKIVKGKDRIQFHSFRHSFEDVVRNLPTVKKEVRDALQGRGELGSSAEYGSGLLLKRLNEGLQQVSYEGLDLGHLENSPKITTGPIKAES